MIAPSNAGFTSRCGRWFGLLILCGSTLPVQAAESESNTDIDVRLRYFASAQALPRTDIGRRLGGTPQYDHNADLRTLVRHTRGNLSFALDHSLAARAGDGLDLQAIGGIGLLVDNDQRRPADLTWSLGRGNRHQVWHRLDRLFVNWSAGNWSATLGRQAISWGAGLVFAPLDLFSPFTPTAVDRDFKPGEDALLLERLFADGSDLQLLTVLRRNDAEEFTGQAASTGAKYRRALGAGELEILVGNHIGDQIAGAGLRWPLGGALLRADVLATRSDDFGGVQFSGLVNVDYSISWRERTVYLFGEYFHNGFGVRELPAAQLGGANALPDYLLRRLERGEVFTLMRDYLAVGVQVQWHPLWTQSQTLIGNLHDGSTLLQLQISYEPADAARIEFGLVATFGGVGKEYGGVPVATVPSTGEPLTSGGAEQAYLRIAYYF